MEEEKEDENEEMNKIIDDKGKKEEKIKKEEYVKKEIEIKNNYLLKEQLANIPININI